MKRFRVWVIVVATLVTSWLSAHRADGQPPKPLAQAHAHNDYLHDRPLLDALAHGFCSVEVDIFLVEGKLLVGHTERELQADRTIQRLYLAPLQEMVRKNGGKVFSDGPEFTLLVDIKSDGPSTYHALRKVLVNYAEILTEYRSGQVTQVHRKAVTAVISGNRPEELIAADDTRYAAIDGRIADLGRNRPTDLVPLISDRWGAHFNWQGTGPMGEDERKRLQRFAKVAHEQGKRIRFWATPDTPAVWRELRSAGVDLINADDLQGLSDFLNNSGRL